MVKKCYEKKFILHKVTLLQLIVFYFNLWHLQVFLMFLIKTFFIYLITTSTQSSIRGRCFSGTQTKINCHNHACCALM